MLSITGGTLRGRRVNVPSHWPIRPTTALVREAVFQRLGSVIEGARFLDLFAGSGLMTWEAFSRGATALVAVDAERPHCSQLISLAQQWQVPVKVVCRKVESFLQKPPTEPFDVVFMDPPYAFEDWDVILPLLRAWTHADSIILIEHDKRSLTNLDVDTRHYGNTVLTWMTGADLSRVNVSMGH
jgi:16S rRNA (guanine966-N2)-methyltransferase